MLSMRHRAFLAVAKSLNFSEAAKVLFMSQPAISKHIKALEDLYKQALFERKGNSIKLTPAGTLLFSHVKEAYKIEQTLEYDLSTLTNKMNAKGELKLGASTTVALYIIPKILSGFHQQYADIKISLLNRNTDTIVKALLEDDISIGIVEGKNKISTITYQPFVTDEVVAVCSAKSQIAKNRFITLKEFVKLPIALREQGSGTLAAVKDWMDKKGIKLSGLNVGIRLAGTEALKNFLLEDHCLGFLPKGSISRELQDGTLIPVNIDHFDIKRNFYFIQRRGSENNEINKSFVRFCKKSL